jgi:ribosomal protein L11
MSLDDVIAVAKVLDADGKNLSKTFANHVKCIIGTVRSFGNVTIDGRTPAEIT